MSATADIWSAHKRSYMGVTLRYVESETLKMASCHLACRRFRGAHTGIAIGEMLYSILKDFGIAAKVQNVVTDNAANFTKAFSLYHTNTDEADTDSEEEITINNVQRHGTQKFRKVNVKESLGKV